MNHRWMSCLLNPTRALLATLAALVSCAAVPPQDAAADLPAQRVRLTPLQQQVQQIAVGAATQFVRCDADCRQPSVKTLGGSTSGQVTPKPDLPQWAAQAASAPAAGLSRAQRVPSRRYRTP